jgi:hypothetical protein
MFQYRWIARAWVRVEYQLVSEFDPIDSIAHVDGGRRSVNELDDLVIEASTRCAWW